MSPVKYEFQISEEYSKCGQTSILSLLKYHIKLSLTVVSSILHITEVHWLVIVRKIPVTLFMNSSNSGPFPHCWYNIITEGFTKDQVQWLHQTLLQFQKSSWMAVIWITRFMGLQSA